MVSSNTFSLSLILFISFSSLFSPSQSHKKVSLELYYESLCPYCANFIVNYLPQIFQNDLTSIVDLKLVPWGNAKLRGNSTIVCQVISSLLLHIYCAPVSNIRKKKVKQNSVLVQIFNQIRQLCLIFFIFETGVVYYVIFKLIWVW